MLHTGKSITTPNDTLYKVPLAYVYNAIKNPKPHVLTQIRQLRQVKQLDEKRYSILKRTLPYLVCGVFNPSIRKTENFARIQYFILDIDHIADKALSVSGLKQTLANDNRVLMAFTSPGQDGLKVLFKLSEFCYDAGKYQLFYKLFATAFAQQYHLHQVLDMRTSDVARACFVSYDPDALFNPNAETIKMDAYIDFNNPLEISEMSAEFKKIEKEQGANEIKEEKPQMPADVLDAIKQKLNPNTIRKPDKIIFVPEEIDAIMNDVLAHLQRFSVEVVALEKIHYGKKIKVRYCNKSAEINMFYGRKGFTLVQTPKRGMDAELGDLACSIIGEVLFNTQPHS